MTGGLFGNACESDRSMLRFTCSPFASAFLTILNFIALVSATAHAGENAGENAGDQIFYTRTVLPLQLTMSAADFEALIPASGGPFGRGGNGTRRASNDSHRNTFGVEFPWSRGDLTFEGKTYKDVGVRYKGNYTYMAAARSLKKSLKIDLNHFVPGQKLDGLTMIGLHGEVSDPTKARESFAYEYFREAGVPAPRTVFAELSLTVPGKHDREYVGVYTLVEQVNKGFLSRHFKNGNGLLLKPEGLQGGPAYLGSSWKAYEDRYQPKSTPTEAQKKRLIDFTQLVSNADDDTFAREIENYLDVDAFLRFIAVNALLSNMDSYLGYGHNYYLYLVPSTNRFVFIPWDLDLSLATWPAVGTPEQLVELSIHHPHAGKDQLIDRLFANATRKGRYLAIIRELTASSFTKDKLLTKLEAIEAALREPREKESKAVAARNEDSSGSRGGPGASSDPAGRVGGRGFGGGPGFGAPGGFAGGGQFGQSMPPRRFIDKRTESVAKQLAGEKQGFEPKPFAAGGGFGGGNGARGNAGRGGGFGVPPRGGAGLPQRGAFGTPGFNAPGSGPPEKNGPSR